MALTTWSAYPKEDKWKTTFCTRYSSYELLGMDYGLTNVPASFQHFMDDGFKILLDVCVVVYLYHIVMYTGDPCSYSACSGSSPSTSHQQLRRLHHQHRRSAMDDTKIRPVFTQEKNTSALRASSISPLARPPSRGLRYYLVRRSTAAH